MTTKNGSGVDVQALTVGTIWRLLDHFDQRFALLFHLILSLLEHRDSNFGGYALRIC